MSQLQHIIGQPSVSLFFTLVFEGDPVSVSDWFAKHLPNTAIRQSVDIIWEALIDVILDFLLLRLRASLLFFISPPRECRFDPMPTVQKFYGFRLLNPSHLLLLLGRLPQWLIREELTLVISQNVETRVGGSCHRRPITLRLRCYWLLFHADLRWLAQVYSCAYGLGGLVKRHFRLV